MLFVGGYHSAPKHLCHLLGICRWPVADRSDGDSYRPMGAIENANRGVEVVGDITCSRENSFSEMRFGNDATDGRNGRRVVDGHIEDGNPIIGCISRPNAANREEQRMNGPVHLGRCVRTHNRSIVHSVMKNCTKNYDEDPFERCRRWIQLLVENVRLRSRLCLPSSSPISATPLPVIVYLVENDGTDTKILYMPDVT